MSSARIQRRSFLKKGLCLAAAATLAKHAKAAAAPVPAKAGSSSALAEDPRPIKKVLFIGDASLAGVAGRVQKTLQSRAELIIPANNCGNTVDVIKQMQGWLKTHNPDVVYVSTGIEDVRSIYYGSYQAMVPRSFYKRNVRGIFEFVYEFSDKAVPMWGTITPVDDERLTEEKARVRDYTFFNDDISAYNKDAHKVCKKMSVIVNDLNLVVTLAGQEAMLNKNGFTLNRNGEQALASSIASAIEQVL